MKLSRLYIPIFTLSVVFLFTMCKSDKNTPKVESNENTKDNGISLNVKVDSSAFDYTSTIDLQYVSLPRMYRWNVVSNSVLKLANNPSGFEVTDTISWIHPSGKSYMSMSHYTRTNDETTDYNMFYEKIKSSYPYTEYSYTKYNSEAGPLHEIKLSNDKTFNYKLIVPKGNEIISIDLQSYADGYDEEIEKFVQQLPGIVRVH